MEVRELLKGKNIGHLATLMPDGSPQVTPMGVDHDGQYVLLNTEEGRQKVLNIRRDARVAISVTDAEKPYTWAAIRGRVVDMTTGGAREHIDELSRRYLGMDTYPSHNPDRARIILRILPDHVTFSLS
jgi:PPOX class probable F420-dependent enzyme